MIHPLILKRTTMKKFIRIFCLLMIVSLPLLAQEEELGSESGPPALGDVPVDGGLSLLLAAGVAYGIHKRRSPRRKGGAKV
jgi:hypothetical protein